MATTQALLVPGLRGGRFGNCAMPLESHESIEILDPLNVFVQIENMRHLKDGWLDGVGKAPSEHGLNWIAEQMDYYFSDGATPYLYPTPEGGIRAEWSLENQEASLEIDLESKSGYWHALDMSNGSDVEKTLDLNKQDAWKWVLAALPSSEQQI